MELKTHQLRLDGAEVELTEYEPGYMLGRLKLFGAAHHMEVIRVELNEDGINTTLEAWDGGGKVENHNADRLDALYAYGDYDGPWLNTMDLSAELGIDGDWLCVITPYS